MFAPPEQDPFDWYLKKQATVETATYGSEFVAARTCVEQAIEIPLTLRYLGVPIRDRSYMFGDNQSVVNSSNVPHGRLHKLLLISSSMFGTKWVTRFTKG